MFLACGLLCFFAVPYAAQDVLTYEGYTIKKLVQRESKVSIAIIKKGKNLLARHTEGFGDYRGTKFELLPILGKKHMQLVVTQFTGGAHCCRRYWVYDLKPSFRLIFQSKDFAIGDGGDRGEGKFQNLDTDKELELVDRSDTFLYFDDLAYVSSPRPLLVFDYNLKTGKFELSNRNFSQYILKDVDVQKKQAWSARADDPGRFGVTVFSIFLDYVYAGREQEARQFYYGNKDIRENGWVHDENKVRKVLNGDRAYKYLYRK